jgi:histidyl-tRNA synthetase
MTGTPYEIDPRLVGHHHCYADTLFSLELRDENDNLIPDAPLTIRGGRLDAFVKHILKMDIPAVGVVVILNTKKAPARLPRVYRPAIPLVFMVQLGFGPKIKSLMLLDTLKAADISVHQALVSDSLSEQLRQAESCKVPFSIILGQKEFVENSIIVRDMRSRSQQNIPFDSLIPHLKRLLKKV